MNTYFNNRENDIQEKYKIHLRLCQHFFSSPSKYLLKKKIDPFQKSYTICKNEFPYRVPHKNIYHYILWIHPKYIKYYKSSRLKSLVYTYFDEKNVVRFFQNKFYLQTVPEIPHYHIFVKNDFKILN